MQGPGDGSIWLRQADLCAYSAVSATLSSSSLRFIILTPRRQPGRHFALSAIWIAVASILATYNITKDVDADGKVVEPSGEWNYEPTLFNHPLPFKCTFTPRSKAAEVVIRATGEDL